MVEPGNFLSLQDRDRHLYRVLARGGLLGPGTRFLEVGSGAGYNLRLMMQWGLEPAQLVGIDLDEAAVEYCRSATPGIRVHLGDARDIPEPDRSFDVVIAFTVLSLTKTVGASPAVAAEMRRVLAPGGLIVVYDMRWRSPNPDVRAVSKKDIESWFPGCRVRARSATLAPPVGRPMASRGEVLYRLAAKVPFLRSHRVFEITPEAA